MVKGLLIRQAFVIIDLGLALLVAFLVYLIADQQLKSRTPKVVPIEKGEIEPSIELAKVSPLDAYDMIGSSGLFGPAGDETPPDEPVVPDEFMEPPPPTLRLHATAATFDPEDPISTAIIENSAAQTVQKVSTYYRGQPVTNELVLKEVYPRKVVLHNPVKNSLSELLMPEAGEKTTPGVPALNERQARQPVQVAQNTEALSLDRNAVAEELASYDYADVVNTLNPEMAEDENGNVTGITSSNFSAVPLAAEIGLQNGDVINTVNGIKIDSDQKLMEIFTKFSNASTFRLGVTRNGSAQMLTFKLE
jgi:type II secretory pathway component PulC